MSHVLIVDDEQSICWGLSKLVEGLGHRASISPSAEAALEVAVVDPPDAIVLDVRLPGVDGLTAMSQFQATAPGAPIIVITAYGELPTAVSAVRNGALDYLVKPFELNTVQRAIERALAQSATVHPTAAASHGEVDGQQIIGSSPAIQEVFKRIAMVAPAEACVHIHGESGTGKELVARAIHRYSQRSGGAFVAVNAASLNPSLAESELFGHVRGAFTGAEQARQGLLEQADGGTIFFDEVADIPADIQVKLLRVLEYGEILPVGASRPVRSNFRVLSATHQSLHRAVAEGRFREDLYFRLNTFQIEIPPLRERREDIADLTEHFLNVLAVKNHCPAAEVAGETRQVLTTRPWHGNVRELRNALEHALILARGGVLLPEHLPPATPANVQHGSHEGSLPEVVREWTRKQLETDPQATDLFERLQREVEPPLLETVLEQHGGQFLSAARQLGLHRVTLRRKMDQYGGGE